MCRGWGGGGRRGNRQDGGDSAGVGGVCIFVRVVVELGRGA